MEWDGFVRPDDPFRCKRCDGDGEVGDNFPEPHEPCTDCNGTGIASSQTGQQAHMSEMIQQA